MHGRLQFLVLCGITIMSVFTSYIYYNGRINALWSKYDSTHSKTRVRNSCHIDSDALIVYTQRQKRLQDVCLTNPPGSLRQIYSHTGHKLSYCAVPKAGCTFWINVFRFLYNETDGVKVKHPNEIPRMITHYGKKKRSKPYSLQQARAFLPNTLRFLFSRDPYSRLWSAYVDKFLLPDYWCTEGLRIIARRSKSASSSRKKNCGNDITFEELLNYVSLSTVKDLDPHWCPVSYMCDPCNFRPDVIGTMETFAKDTNFVLSQVNLQHIMDNYDPKTHVVDEMVMLTEYNFQLLKRTNCKHCIKREDIALRLWKAFQINGYLPLKTEFPSEKLKDIDASTFIDVARKTYRERPNSSAQIKIQRKQALVDAYKSVPSHIMQKLKSIYATDFLMFNYDPNPSWLKLNTSETRS
ncbi:carbohydrate sulfotransferase 11-like isoform X2 [Gigantopelta aegis]|nr:carbohydrate sulfotransferase 11-like isoform X2 [Gigantopelta aegis]